jgi:hypothetical protein
MTSAEEPSASVGPTWAGPILVVVAAFRKWVGWAGLVAMALVGANIAMMQWSLARNVHCLGCNGRQIASGIAWWEAFYELKAELLVQGSCLGLVAAVIGKPRWFGVIALVGAWYVSAFLTFK